MSCTSALFGALLPRHLPAVAIVIGIWGYRLLWLFGPALSVEGRVHTAVHRRVLADGTILEVDAPEGAVAVARGSAKSAARGGACGRRTRACEVFGQGQRLARCRC